MGRGLSRRSRKTRFNLQCGMKRVHHGSMTWRFMAKSERSVSQLGFGCFCLCSGRAPLLSLSPSLLLSYSCLICPTTSRSKAGRGQSILKNRKARASTANSQAEPEMCRRFRATSGVYPRVGESATCLKDLRLFNLTPF